MSGWRPITRAGSPRVYPCHLTASQVAAALRCPGREARVCAASGGWTVWVREAAHA